MAIWQIILLTLFAFIKKVDQKGTQVVIGNSMFWGAVTGLIMGDFRTGLYIGGTFQLMSLGVAALGGSSVPDYQIGTIIATAIAVGTGQGMEAGIALGLPICMLAVQFDVIGNIIHGYLIRKAQAYCNQKNFKKMELMQWVCVLITGLTTAIPTFLALALGGPLVEAILNYMPAWFTSGLALAGKILPLCGISILLTYMPVKGYFEYLLIGFVLSAYLKVPMLGVAIVGVALAFMLYKNKMSEMNRAEVIGGGEDE